jgi:hypothetical protein
MHACTRDRIGLATHAKEGAANPTPCQYSQTTQTNTTRTFQFQRRSYFIFISFITSPLHISSLCPSLLRVLVHLSNTSVLEGVLVVVRGSLRGRRRVHFLEAAQVHVTLEQRDDVGIEGLPVGVLEVVFLALFWGGFVSKGSSGNSVFLSLSPRFSSILFILLSLSSTPPRACVLGGIHTLSFS